MPFDFSLIPTASHVFFALFLAASIVHLTFCALDSGLPRKITKPFPMLFLSIAAIIAVPTHPIVYIGLIMGLIGDIALIEKKSVWNYAIGLSCFYVNHVLFLVETSIHSDKVPTQIGIAALIVMLVLVPFASFILIKFAGVKPKGLGIAGSFYAVTVLANAFVPLIACGFGNVDYLYLVAIGGFFFAISDSLLVLTNFKKKIKRQHFFIMLPYLLAESLITIGFVMTLLK